MSYRYPKTVPVLTADDICKGSLRDNGHSCILGWLGLTFLPINRDDLCGVCLTEEDIWKQLPKAVLVSVDEQSPIYRPLRSCESVYKVNDGKYRKLSDIAAWFNRITASLGYVVGNPEAKNVKGKP